MLVFISHASEDAPVARTIAEEFRSAGFSVWIAPDSILPGQAYNEAIVAGLQASDVVAVLVSSATNQSRHVAREVALADDQRKRLAPIRIEPVEPSDGLKYYLSLPQWIEWHAHREAALHPLIDLLRSGAPREPETNAAFAANKVANANTAPTNNLATIEVHRPKSFNYSMRNLAILIDGQKVGEVASGSSIRLVAPAGQVEISARADWFKSAPFIVDAAPGITQQLEVRVIAAADVRGQLAGLLGSSNYLKWSKLD